VNRLVACKGTVNGQIIVIADSYCEGLSKPSGHVDCAATAECNHYRWEISDESCPYTCGLLESTLSRDITCVVFTLSNPMGVVVADSFCDSATRPDAALHCPDTPPCGLKLSPLARFLFFFFSSFGFLKMFFLTVLTCDEVVICF
jgi:hypothetical protein